MDHLKVTVTKEQRANLRKLARFLDRVQPKRFDMSTFTNQSAYPAEAKYECGTVACAAGHGPACGIKANKRESWLDYTERAFGAPEDEPFFLWCFGGVWDDTDNRPAGAAARIRYALDNGVPDNYRAQMYGRRRRSYTVPRKPA